VGAATGAAMIALVLAVIGGERRDALAALMRAVAAALVVQAIALVLFVVTVKMSGSVGISGALAPLLSGQYSLPFWLGAVVAGLVVPLALQFGGGLRRASAGVAALVAILVLLGGFVIKHVLIAAGQVT
jgi:formate-dependent nitrite reductase membrane component NrfD